MAARNLVCAVDVGTGSARAAIFDSAGTRLGHHIEPITVRRPQVNFAEYDSEEIWSAVCTAVRRARAQAKVEANRIAGLGFGATCSLIARDAQGGQISVSPTGDDHFDSFVWLDHRARAQADACTATGHPALDTIGGQMSPEMQVPKAMWLKENLPQSWSRLAKLFDLPDFLTWKATGDNARSHCTLTCKWTYQPHTTPHWQQDFLQSVGIADFVEKAGLPADATPLGGTLGKLSPEAADALRLDTDCYVAPGMIDAYAGALGLLGAYAADAATLERQIALIAGTSTCLMTVTQNPFTLTGGWGPYPSVVLPGFSVTEGGQSATGALLDHVIQLKGGGAEPTPELHDRITRRIGELLSTEGYALAHTLHVLPDFHGNRTPHADPYALGVISGLSLDTSFDGLCRLYWRTAVAIALSLREILETLDAEGVEVEMLHITGGHARTRFLPQLYADVTGRAVALREDSNAMLVGSAMTAAVAAGLYPDLPTAGTAMSDAPVMLQPNRAARAQFDRDFEIQKTLRTQRRTLAELIAQPL